MPDKKAEKKAEKKYEYSEPVGWADKVAHFAQALVDGYTLVLDGPCPRCIHDMGVELPLRKRTGGFVIEDALPREKKADFEKTARCNCKMDHEGRPDDVKSGCGAYGLLEVWL